jgi:lysozyme family protein
VSFDEAFKDVVGIEGRYSNDPKDSGGETMYGITLRVARAEGYTGAMDAMPLAIAKSIYRSKYWDLHRLDSVMAIAGGRVAHEMFECAVNLPWGKAGTFLQRALNAMNQEAVMYADIPVDGQVGNLTLESLRSFMRRRGNEGATVLLRALNAQQGMHYLTLAEARQKDERFVYGWFNNRVQFA